MEAGAESAAVDWPCILVMMLRKYLAVLEATEAGLAGSGAALALGGGLAALSVDREGLAGGLAEECLEEWVGRALRLEWTGAVGAGAGGSLVASRLVEAW